MKKFWGVFFWWGEGGWGDPAHSWAKGVASSVISILTENSYIHGTDKLLESYDTRTAQHSQSGLRKSWRIILISWAFSTWKANQS